MPLNEPVELRCTMKRFSIDEEGEATLTLRVPASDGPAALRVSMLRGIVLKAQFEPESVEEKGAQRL
jgi:hypothetical protein